VTPSASVRYRRNVVDADESSPSAWGDDGVVSGKSPAGAESITIDAVVPAAQSRVGATGTGLLTPAVPS